MMKSLIFSPLFVACSVILTALPKVALAQVVARPIAGFTNASVGAAVLGGVSKVPTLAQFTIAPALTPLFGSPAAALTLSALVAAPVTMIRTPGAAATGISAEAAAVHPARLAASENQPAQEKDGRGIVADVSPIVRDEETSEMFTGGVRGQGALAAGSIPAQAAELIVNYGGWATITRFNDDGSSSISERWHDVIFHYDQKPDGGFTPEFYVEASWDKGPKARVFFLNARIIDSSNEVYLLEAWGNSSNGTKPEQKLGTVKFIGAPGKWQSYSFEPDCVTINDPDIRVSGGSIFTIDAQGRRIMLEDDTYTRISTGRVLSRKIAELLLKR